MTCPCGRDLTFVGYTGDDALLVCTCGQTIVVARDIYRQMEEHIQAQLRRSAAVLDECRDRARRNGE